MTEKANSRARSLGLLLPGQPGRYNAITDVAGVEVGVSTIIRGEGKLIVGQGPVRTGVTAILPRGKSGAATPCAAGYSSFNGNGEMTGVLWIEEAGELQTPITITNTHSCGVTRDATLQWMTQRGVGSGQDWGLPVAAETYDGDLNDINGFHVTAQHVFEALDSASSGPVAMGAVGGGTGMICYDFKAGNGSSSRRVTIDGQPFTVGVFVQSNFGARELLTILGVPVGRSIVVPKLRGRDQGSIIAIVATDAPLLPHQLKRLARRVPMGMARTGAIGSNSSGDIFLAFSTANSAGLASQKHSIRSLSYVSNSAIDPLFAAVVEATEEAIIDSMLCAETMVGRDGHTSHALPHEPLLDLLRAAGRIAHG